MASATGPLSALSHPSGACVAPRRLQGLESRDRARGDRLERPGGDGVDADPARARARARDSGRSPRAPLLPAPSSRRAGHATRASKVSVDDRAACFRHQWRERGGERLQRVAADVERGRSPSSTAPRETRRPGSRRERSRSRGPPRRRRPRRPRTCSATACTWATSVTSISRTSGTGFRRLRARPGQAHRPARMR